MFCKYAYYETASELALIVPVTSVYHLSEERVYSAPMNIVSTVDSLIPGERGRGLVS